MELSGPGLVHLRTSHVSEIRCPSYLLALCIAAMHPTPGFTQTRHMLETASFRYDSQNWSEALPAYEALVAVNPYHGQHWFRLGEVYRELKRPLDSTRAFKKAFELGYMPTGTMYQIARAYALQNRAADAVQWLDRTLTAHHGAMYRSKLDKETDFDAIRQHTGFRKILSLSKTGMTRVPGWRSDLRFLTGTMEKCHYDVFRAVSRNEWEATIARIDRSIPHLKDHEVIVQFMKLIAMLGDGHTRVFLPSEGPYRFRMLPVRFYEFKDGLFIESAAPQYKHAVGLRVMSVGNEPVEDALSRLRSVSQRDNEMTIKLNSPMYMAIPEILHALKISDSPDEVELRLENHAGRNVFITLKAERFSPIAWSGRMPSANWTSARDNAKAPPPLWLKKANEPYWFEYLAEPKVVYFQLNMVRNGPQETLATFCSRLFRFIASRDVAALVIDIRLNDGGNSFLIPALIHELVKAEDIKQEGKLFTIIGRRTFSAAVNLAAELEMNTPTLFVGEPTGASPNFVGETDPELLPFSQLKINASNLYHQRSYLPDHRPWIAPDLVAELTLEQFSCNVDPAMMAILSYIRPTENSGQLENGPSKIVER